MQKKAMRKKKVSIENVWQSIWRVGHYRKKEEGWIYLLFSKNGFVYKGRERERKRDVRNMLEWLNIWWKKNKGHISVLF